jgi:hypothetical protein
LEVTFVSEQALKGFLELVNGAENWQVECELTALTVVTLVPRAGGDYTKIGDSLVVTMLSRYGEVREGKRLVYRDFPTVETGVRQFKVKLSGKAAVPSVVNFGKTSFFVSHKGQVKTCIRCGRSGHLVKECEVTKCYKCGEEGHTASVCQNEIKCTVCQKDGHTFRNCPNTFSGVLKLSNRFSKITPSRVSEQDKGKSSGAAEVEATNVTGSQSDEVEIEKLPDTQTASDSQCVKAIESVEASQSQDLFDSPPEVLVSPACTTGTTVGATPDLVEPSGPSTRSRGKITTAT